MKFYTYGNPENPVILLFPGTCCHHRTFDFAVPYLQEHFYTAVASYDGFDETEDTIFPDMITETEKIEEYIQEHFGGRVFAAYGCSLGGSFVGLLIQRKKIHIDHGFLGSSDLDQAEPLAAKAQAAIVAPMFHHFLQSGKLPSLLEKGLNKRPEQEKKYITDFLRLFGIGEGAVDMSFVSEKSMYNQFYSDLITPLENAIAVEGTKVHIFYALKMGDEYEKRYRMHFKNPDIRRHPLQHEELLVRLPEAWTKEILACCGMEGGEAFTGAQDPSIANRRMKKVLIYGAGVIGCYLAYVLMRAGNEVVVYARGDWKKNLETSGMILHHILQHTETTDYPAIIGEIPPEESYDAVFAAMQQNQLLAAAPELGRIHTPLIVCVGNNLRAKEVEEEIRKQAEQNSVKVLFGFQGTSGCRKGTKVECLHTGKGSMSIGELGKEADADVQDLLNGMFEKSGFVLEWQKDMDSWLWCHMAFILPLVFAAYRQNCDLRTMTAEQMDLVMEAAGEGMELLRKSGYRILPEGEGDYYVPGSAKRKAMTALMLAMGKTRFGDYCVTDHCRHAAMEMHAAENAWNELREKQKDYAMPAWDKLRKEMPDWTELEERYGSSNTGPETETKNGISAGKVMGIAAAATAAAVIVRKLSGKK